METGRRLVTMLLLLATGPALAGPVTPSPPPRRPQRPVPAQAPLPRTPTALAPGAFAVPNAPPLPPPRPADLRPAAAQPQPAPPPVPDRPALPGAAASAPLPGRVSLEEAYACLRLFRGGWVEARLRPPLAPEGPGCGIASPVEIAAFARDPSGGRVRVEPPLTVGCAMANATAAWVRDDLAPAFGATGSPLAALTGMGGYACRSRNGVAGAKPSEHGRGEAVDIGGFIRADRTAIEVRQTDAPILAQVRATACARFATVLGPGSDGFHEAHLHIDIEERRNRFAICHWDRL